MFICITILKWHLIWKLSWGIKNRERKREREKPAICIECAIALEMYACHRMISDENVLFCCINFHRKYLITDIFVSVWNWNGFLWNTFWGIQRNIMKNVTLSMNKVKRPTKQMVYSSQMHYYRDSKKLKNAKTVIVLSICLYKREMYDKNCTFSSKIL